MAGKQITGDGLSSNLAGMSKNQLYDIMSQMKTLIEQNQQQARQILIQNPLLTKSLFQAQIMLGMVQPPQAIPSIQPQASQQQSQLPQQLKTQVAPSLPSHVGVQDLVTTSQNQPPPRKPPQNQPAMPNSSASVPAPNLHSQSMPSHPLMAPQQPMGHMNPQVTSVTLPQSSQLPNISSLPHTSASKPPPLHQSQSHVQQSLQSPGISHLPLQPPMPPQHKPPFHHQYPPHMGPSGGFQHSNTQHLSQPMYHSSMKPPPNIGHSFSQGHQGQPPIPNLPPSQSLFQGRGPHLGPDFNNQVGSSMQMDRGSWMTGQSENQTGMQLPGPPPFIPGQMGTDNQPPRGAPLSAEMEKALLQQVMSLTPEQINLLPPDQRNQVLQLQQMLRQ